MLKVKFRPLIVPLALSSYLLCMNEARADLCAVISDVLGRSMSVVGQRVYDWSELFAEKA